MRILGIDIGGTSIKLGIADRKGRLSEFDEYPTESGRGGGHIVKTAIDRIAAHKNIDAIGVSVPGQIDRENGIVVNGSANLPGTSGLEIKALLENRFRVPVAVENDVNAAALGEKRFGAGKGKRDFLFLAYGTGIGGAIVIDSELYGGTGGYAGEFGHMIIDKNGNKCTCGLRGCYEAHASVSALVREVKRIDATCIDGKIIFRKCHEGDKRVMGKIDVWVDEVVVGLVSLTHIFNPSTILLGGGIMEEDSLANMIASRLNDTIIGSFKRVEVERAALGNKAGMLGAVSLHLQSLT